MAGINDPNFADVREELQGISGIFGGDGYQSTQRCTPTLNPDGSGYLYSFICQGCGRGIDFSVTWDEFLYAMARKKPIDPETRREWIYDQQRGGVYPPTVHNLCQTPIPLLITAQEAAQRVEAGMHASKLDPQYVERALRQLGAPRVPPLGAQQRRR